MIDTPSVTFQVIGTPAPQGSKRHVGRGILIESSKKVGPWREAVAHAAADALSDGSARAFDTPVRVTMLFYLARPKRKPKWPQPGTRPDLSKLVRSTEDALVQAGLIQDDALIVSLSASKLYVLHGQATGADIVVQMAPEHHPMGNPLEEQV